MNNEFNALRENHAGHAFVELAIVLPLVLMLAFAGLEFSKVLKQWQIATTISRELASIALRDCSAESGTVSTEDLDLNYCLSESSELLKSRIKGLLPESILIVSLYDTSGTSSRASIRQVAVVGETTTYKSRFNPEKLRKPGSTSGEAALELQSVVIAEVYLPYQSIVGGNYRYLSKLGALYSASIM